MDWDDDFELDEPDGDVWTTRDGRVVRVSEMTDTHLQNTIQYVRRRRAKTLGLGPKSDPPIVKAMIEELKRRGIWRPTAEDVRGSIKVSTLPAVPPPRPRRLVFDEFLEEVDRRKRERTPRRAAPKPAAPEPSKSPWARDLDIDSEKK